MIADYTRNFACAGTELARSKCSACWPAHSAATRAEARGERVGIAACHMLLRPVAQLVRVTAECVTVLGSALAVTTPLIFISMVQGMRATPKPRDLPLLAGLRQRPGWQQGWWQRRETSCPRAVSKRRGWLRVVV